MIDEQFDRHYQHARGHLNSDIASGLTRFASTVAVAFAALNRIEYSAPWTQSAPEVRRG